MEDFAMSLPNVEEFLFARPIEKSFTPKIANPIYDLQYAVRSMMSAQVLTGDYYDFIPVGRGNLGLLIADICGKDLPSYVLAARLRVFLEMQERYIRDDVRELTRKANEFFYHSSGLGEFASLFFGRYEARSGRLSYVNCGQIPPLLVRLDGSVRKLGFTAPVIGISEKWNAASDEVCLQGGDTLVMVTDGVTETIDRKGEQFGDNRLLEVIRVSVGKKTADIANAILEAVTNFSGGVRQDDLTAVVARVKLDRQEPIRESETRAVWGQQCL
jgi:serine phosphatase RsbU (regulator of sigma subunit)